MSSFPRLRNPLSESNNTTLLVDVTEALPLLALLQQTSGSHDEDGVDTDHAEDRSKYVVDQDVGEGVDGSRTGTHERGGGWAGADVVGDEGR